METVKVTKWTAKNTKSDGSPLTGKFGPYWMVGIQVEGEDFWRNGFINGAAKPEDWTGKEVSLELTETEKDGKTYKNFKIPKKGSLDTEKIDKILENTEMLLNRQVRDGILLQELVAQLKGKKDSYPTESNETAFDEETPF